MVRTTVFWVTAFVTVVLCSPVVFLLRSRKSAIHGIQRSWARLLLRISGAKVSITGLDNIRAHQPYFIMANHQSYHDILVLLTLPVFIHWMAKKELFRIPFLGWILTWIDAISIDRGNRGKAFASVKKAATKIRHGATVLIFPEGTRSPDGRLLPFNKGGFFLAAISKVPVLPIIIAGTHKIMPKGSFRISPAVVNITIKPPVDTKSLASKDRGQLEKKIRAIFLETLPSAADYPP